jgi:hypothetical protein
MTVLPVVCHRWPEQYSSQSESVVEGNSWYSVPARLLLQEESSKPSSKNQENTQVCQSWRDFLILSLSKHPLMLLLTMTQKCELSRATIFRHVLANIISCCSRMLHWIYALVGHIMAFSQDLELFSYYDGRLSQGAN